MNEKNVFLIEQTHCLVHTFSNRHVCSWRHFLSYLYSRFSHFFLKKILSSLHYISFIFVRLFCKLSSSASSDPYHFGGTRSVLSWETIVHYPQYNREAKFVLRTRRLFVGLGSAFCFLSVCLHSRFVSFIILFLVF